MNDWQRYGFELEYNGEAEREERIRELAAKACALADDNRPSPFISVVSYPITYSPGTPQTETVGEYRQISITLPAGLRGFARQLTAEAMIAEQWTEND